MRDGIARETVSAYYPPRARWYTTLFFHAGQQLRRRVGLDKLHLAGELSWPGLILSLAVPGFAFFVFGRRLLGWLFLPAYCLAGFVFVAALGFTAGSIAYGLMISLHATSIVFLEGYWLRDSGFRLRLALALCTLVGVWALVYAPLVRFAEHHWLLPVRFGQRVLLVHRGVSPATLKRGDWVAYRIRADDSWGEERGAVLLRSGLAIDPVLGLPGDHIRFSAQGVAVNARTFPRAPYMPTEGELVVPEKVWFIWPNLAITMHGGVAPADISAAMQRAAMVTQTNIIGRPSRYWFGRRQWP
ncbi:MAG TPA: hypothetical protein VNZ64_19325 [Candidatus Acidoferrum sp.]|jgi:hypothetical protein|nr:hypothetical protein [Candidatus Acidoferrum sp.]